METPLTLARHLWNKSVVVCGRGHHLRRRLLGKLLKTRLNNLLNKFLCRPYNDILSSQFSKLSDLLEAQAQCQVLIQQL
jgi:hypothetical protein